MAANRPLGNRRWRLRLPSAGIVVYFAVFLAALFPALAHSQIVLDTGRVITSEGRVSVERSGELWVLLPGKTLQTGEVLVTGSDGFAVLELPDNSRIEVFPNSRLVFRANRFDWRDLLDLYLGKVRLSIQRLTHEESPYRVTSPTAVISIRGTVLEVEVGMAQETRITVEDGSVGVRHRLLPGKEIVVEAGQSLEVSPNVPLAAVKGTAPLFVIGRIARTAVEAVARLEQMTGKSGGGATAGPGSGTASGPRPSGSDAGSHEPAPAPGEDKSDAPPGDVIPPP